MEMNIREQKIWCKRLYLKKKKEKKKRFVLSQYLWNASIWYVTLLA